MAIIRLGPIVGGISGTLGGVVFANTRKSTIVRPRPAPLSKSSPFLARSRARMYNLRRTWSTLTTLQQDAWRTAAADINSTNALGQSSPMSGFTYFITTNKVAFPGFFETFPFPATLVPADFAVNPAVAFSAAGNFDASIDNPDSPSFLKIQVYGWPFWVDHATKSVARLVFLQETTSNSDPIVLNVRTEWIAHFGDMIPGQQFSCGVKARFSHSPFNPITMFRQAVTA